MSNGLTAYTYSQALATRKDLESKGIKSKIVAFGDHYKVIPYSWGETPPPVPETRILPEEVEETLTRELEARERERIRKGIPTGREIGRVRWIGGQKVALPIKVSPETAATIGAREEARLIKAKELVTKHTQLELQINKLAGEAEELQAAIETNRRAIEDARRAGAPEDRETVKALRQQERKLAQLERQFERVKKEYSKVEKQLPKAKEVEAEGGAYLPAVRTALAAGARVSAGVQELKGVGSRALETMATKSSFVAPSGLGHFRKGMKKAIPVSAELAQAKGEKVVYLAKIGKVGAPEIAQAPTGEIPIAVTPKVGGIATTPSAGIKAETGEPGIVERPESQGQKFVLPKRKLSSEIDLSKLKDERYGKSLGEG